MIWWNICLWSKQVNFYFAEAVLAIESLHKKEIIYRGLSVNDAMID